MYWKKRCSFDTNFKTKYSVEFVGHESNRITCEVLYEWLHEKFINEVKILYKEQGRIRDSYLYGASYTLAKKYNLKSASTENSNSLIVISAVQRYMNDMMNVREAIRSALSELEEEYESHFSIRVIEKWGKSKWKPKKEVFEANMRKDIAKEKDRKYDKLIDDVENITGKIIDMSHIKVGVKGDLEGYVIGANGEAELWASGAGGFNTDVIVNVNHGQCFHFRFYVKRRA